MNKGMTENINFAFTVVIPARFASTRLPGKPLALIDGKPMVQHVFERAQLSAASKVIVATDDPRVYDAVSRFGGNVCMTASSHVSGTDRIHEVSAIYGLDAEAIVVNVQGDEPLIPPAVINQVAINLYQRPQAAAATLSEPITVVDDFHNPNIVKVVIDHSGFALYFSRATIPFARDGIESLFGSDSPIVRPQRHIGIYAYRVGLLQQFVEWPVAALEAIECLEQLRILANGQKIHVAEALEEVPGGIDTPADLAKLQALLSSSQ
jgi:3-deoxy-manno-octulosonate cytidylyltransferase (CMP-KDO synthetase)